MYHELRFPLVLAKSTAGRVSRDRFLLTKSTNIVQQVEKSPGIKVEPLLTPDLQIKAWKIALTGEPVKFAHVLNPA